MDVYLPDGDGTLRPGVMMIHGGAWRSGDRGHFTATAKRLARAGYVVATIDYRLVLVAIVLVVASGRGRDAGAGVEGRWWFLARRRWTGPFLGLGFAAGYSSVTDDVSGDSIGGTTIRGLGFLAFGRAPGGSVTPPSTVTTGAPGAVHTGGSVRVAVSLAGTVALAGSRSGVPRNGPSDVRASNVSSIGGVRDAGASPRGGELPQASRKEPISIMIARRMLPTCKLRCREQGRPHHLK